MEMSPSVSGEKKEFTIARISITLLWPSYMTGIRKVSSVSSALSFLLAFHGRPFCTMAEGRMCRRRMIHAKECKSASKAKSFHQGHATLLGSPLECRGVSPIL